MVSLSVFMFMFAFAVSNLPVYSICVVHLYTDKFPIMSCSLLVPIANLQSFSICKYYVLCLIIDTLLVGIPNCKGVSWKSVLFIFNRITSSGKSVDTSPANAFTLTIFGITTNDEIIIRISTPDTSLEHPP